MRIYLTQAVDVVMLLESGQAMPVSYPSSGFYANVPEVLARSWIEQRIAFEATDDNKIRAYRPEHEAGELVDLDAGGRLLPEHSPVPTVQPAAVEPSTGAPDDGSTPPVGETLVVEAAPEGSAEVI